MDLHGLQEHLQYEVDMLRGTALALASDADKSLPWQVRMSLIEAFTIHARNLLDFYYIDQSKKPDDAFAVHYFPTVEAWHAVRGDEPPNLGDLRNRVNKQIAHLTYTRIGLGEGERKWHIGEMRELIERLNCAFADNAPPEALTDDYRRYLRGKI